MIPQTGEIWQHHKTRGKYEIIGIGQMQLKIEALDMKECAIYKALSDGKLWVRPLDDFTEYIENETGENVLRFSKIR